MELSTRGRQIRRDTYALSKANGGYHYGGSFSCVEILIALYDRLKIGHLGNHDRFVMSKGHSCWPWYVILREQNRRPLLEGHPSRDEVNGVTSTTGSEGHGFPTAIGIAMARKMLDRPGRVFVLVGDGECQEGTTWESLLLAVRHGLDNLTVIIDMNGIQGSGYIRDILPLPDMSAIAACIGWRTVEIDGHDVDEIVRGLSASEGEPLLVVARTKKGGGVSFMEDRPEWHAKWPNTEEEKLLLEELA